jgi:hypothetical protein
MEAFAMTCFRGVSYKPLSASLGLLPAALLLTFASGARPVHAAPGPQALRMTCSSDNMRRHVCAVDTSGGVQMVHQKSDAKCIQNRTWGYDNRGIWVDRGCRAEFEVGVTSAGPAPDGRELQRGGDFRGWGESYMVYCASDEMERVWCPADSRFGVRLIRQRSEAACIQGQTWGYGKRGIWADRGCRADFVVSGNWQSRGAAIIYCPSDDMQRNFCAVNTLDGVFIVRQRSEADCVFNRTWGYDRDRIWVDRGCRADFEVIDRRDREWRDWSRDWDDDDRRGWDRDHHRDRDRDRDDYRDRDDRPPYLN